MSSKSTGTLFEKQIYSLRVVLQNSQGNIFNGIQVAGHTNVLQIDSILDIFL